MSTLFQRTVRQGVLALCTASLCALSINVKAASVHAGQHCNPLHLNTCGLPFPSDYWSEADPASPTGTTLTVSNSILSSAVANQLPVATGISFDSMYEGSSGFSAASAVIFEFANTADSSSLPKYGGDAVVAYNLDTGETVGIRTQLSAYARSAWVKTPSQILEIFPQSRWAFGHRILVAVTKELRIDGETADFSTLAQTATGPQRDYIDQLQSALAQAGLDSRDVRTATLFTVRDQNEVVEPIRTLVNETYASDHPVRNLKVQYKSLLGTKAALITGELQTSNYRRDNGTGMVDFNASPVPQWIPFRLTLPTAARKQGGVPVALYAHGILGQKESDTGLNAVSDVNAGLGIATFSIDFPNHGARIKIDGSSVISNLSLARASRQVGMVTQNAMDFASAHKALIGLSDLDVVGQWRLQSRCWNCADGIADLDTSRVFMQGTSLGGVLGSSYAALSPDIDGALYQVSGVGVGSILSRSVAWDFLFANVVPRAANGAEALLFKTALQQLLDPGDSINYIELMRNPESGGSPRPTLVLTGKGDWVVGNDSSVAMAQILDLPLVGKQHYLIPGARQLDAFDDSGFAILQYPPLGADFRLLIGDLLTGLTAHGAVAWPAATRAQKEWLQRFVLRR